MPFAAPKLHQPIQSWCYVQLPRLRQICPRKEERIPQNPRSAIERRHRPEDLHAQEFTQEVFPAVCLKKQDAVPRPNNYWIQLFEFYTIRWLMPLRLRRMSSDMTTRIWGKRADENEERLHREF